MTKFPLLTSNVIMFRGRRLYTETHAKRPLRCVTGPARCACCKNACIHCGDRSVSRALRSNHSLLLAEIEGPCRASNATDRQSTCVLIMYIIVKCNGCRDWGAIVPPWPAYYAVMATASGLDHLRNMLTPPPIRMIEHSFAFTRTQVQQRCLSFLQTCCAHLCILRFTPELVA